MRIFDRLFRRRHLDRRIEQELQFHVDEKVNEYVAAGLTRAEAKRRTRLEFGGTQQIKEEVHEASIFAFLDTFRADVRYAVRGLRRSPGFAIAAMLALALGSGGTTALATILNDLILRPPRLFRHAHELVIAGETSPQDPSFVRDVAPAVYQQWRSARALERIAAIRDLSLVVSIDGEIESATAQAVSPDLFDILGTSPILGRGFAPDDDMREAPPVALVSYGYWQQRFAGSPAILARRLAIGGRSHAVVGVLPREYALNNGANILIPLARDMAIGRDGGGDVLVVGRRRAGVDIKQVRAELSALQHVAEQSMANRGSGWGLRVDPMRGRTGLGGRGLARVFPLFFAVALLTLVATSSNLAILMVARGMARVKEVAVRAALGASRYRLMQQVLLESLLLAAGGGALGLVVAVALSRFLISIAPGAVPSEFEVPLDLQVFGLAALIVMIAGVASGAAPALAAARTDVETLKGLALPGRRPRRLRGALVVLEFGITMVLLVVVGLCLDAYGENLNLDPGFDRTNLLTVRVDADTAAEGSGQRPIAVSDREIAGRLQSVAGVSAVTVGSVVPPLRGGRELPFAIEGGPAQASGRLADVDTKFFATLGLKTLRGRTFNDVEPGATEQIVISDVLAGRYWSSADPVGQFIRIEGEPRVRQIVGVVSDVRRNIDLRRGRIPYLYRLRSGRAEAGGPERREVVYALLRTSSNAAALAPQVRAALQEIFPGRPMPAPATLEAMLSRMANELLLMAFLFMPMVLLTLALSAAGIYGLIAQTVTMRTRELGIRAALGAERRELVGLILRDGLRLARTGLIFGLAGVIAINRALMSVFVGIAWADPSVVVLCALLMLAVALAASYRPASRAARVDPMTALRCE